MHRATVRKSHLKAKSAAATHTVDTRSRGQHFRTDSILHAARLILDQEADPPARLSEDV